MTSLHFAQLDAMNVVTGVLVVNSTDVDQTTFPESEAIGSAYLNRVVGPGTFIQTDIDGTYRRRFAGPGMTFDYERDVFLEPQPYPSWSLDDNHDWQAPIARPDDTTKHWVWNEEQQEWVGFDKPAKPPVETLGE